MQKHTGAQIDLAKLKFLRDQCKGRFKEGDKVKLNIGFMKSSPNWDRKTEDYRGWCETHRDQELTVVYDESRKVDPELVCLEEDKTSPKWLFSVTQLVPADGDDGFVDIINWIRVSSKK